MKLFKFIMTFNIILAIIAYFGICVYAENTTYVWSNNSNTIATNENTNSEADLETTSEPQDSSSNALNLESESAILIEQHSGQILYEHNIHEQLRPASVTKVMSILLIMEQIDSRQA